MNVDRSLPAIGQPATRMTLSGGWLWTGRLVWLALTVLVLLTLSQIWPENYRITYSEWMVHETRSAVQTVMSYGDFVRLVTILESLSTAITLLTGFVIFWYKSNDKMGLFVSAFLILAAPWILSSNMDTWRLPAWAPLNSSLVSLLRAGTLSSLVLFFYLFPDGRFTPRWTRWPVLLLCVMFGAYVLGAFLHIPAPFANMWAVYVMTFFAALVIAAAAQLYRYRTHTDTAQRQQMKWVIWGFGLYIILLVPSSLGVFSLPAFTWGPVINLLALMLAQCFIPLAIGFSILRYRLWDIDLIINRTVVYGGLMLLVTTVYALIVGGAAVLFQSQARAASAITAVILISLILPPAYRHWQKIINQLVPMPERPARPAGRQEPVLEVSTISLNGHSLLLARLAWGFTTLLSLVIFIASLQLAVATDLFAQMPQLAAGIEVALFSVFANNQFLSNNAILYLVYAQFLVFMAVGLFLFWRKSNDWLAILAAIMLVTTGVGFSPAVFFLPILSPAWHIPVSLLQAILFSALIWFLYLFPNGCFTPPWTRPAAFLWGLYALGWLIWPQLNPHRGGNFIALLIFIGWAWTGLVAQIYRYRQTQGIERQQQKWVMVGFFLTHLCFAFLVLSSAAGWNQQLVTLAPTPFMLLNSLLGLSSILIPITIAFAILRYRLWEVDVWINRSVVYGGLTLLVTAVYILTVGLMSNLFQSGSSLALSVFATGLIAILFNPARQRLQTAVNRLMYGERDDPITVLTALGRRLEETVAPAETLPTLVETIAQTLKLPYVAIVGNGEVGEQTSRGAAEILAAYPSLLAAHPAPLAFPLIYHAQTIGQLLVAPRAPGEAFTPAERRLLENVARQAGAAVHAARLTADLQRSRERLVTAREEERRRLRRDLHDGLGPQLATLTLKVDAARNYLRQEPETTRPDSIETTDHLLLELKREIQEAIQDIRRLAYNLRPPALDQLGLAPALCEYAAQNSGNSLLITVDAPAALPPLSAAVEVAAYRIALEAITNVVRHARATHCRVKLSVVGDGLYLEIDDNGVGLPEAPSSGVGLASMRERAAELGGAFDLRSAPAEGTQVSIRLPILRS